MKNYIYEIIYLKDYCLVIKNNEIKLVKKNYELY